MIAERATTPSSPSSPSPSSPLNHNSGFIDCCPTNPKKSLSLTSDLNQPIQNFKTQLDHHQKEEIPSSFQKPNHPINMLNHHNDNEEYENHHHDDDEYISNDENFFSKMTIDTSNNNKNKKNNNNNNEDESILTRPSSSSNTFNSLHKYTSNNSSASSVFSNLTSSSTTTPVTACTTSTTTNTDYSSSFSQSLLMNPSSNMFEENSDASMLSVVTTKTSHSSLFSSVTDTSSSSSGSATLHVPLVLNHIEEPFEDVFDEEPFEGEMTPVQFVELQKSNKKTENRVNHDRNNCCDENAVAEMMVNNHDDWKRKNMTTRETITTMDVVNTPHNADNDDDVGLKPLNLTTSKWKSQNISSQPQVSTNQDPMNHGHTKHVVIEEEIEEGYDDDDYNDEEHDEPLMLTTTALTKDALLPFRSQQKISKNFSTAANVSTPQYSPHPAVSSATSPFKVTPKSAFHLRNASVTSDVTVYSNMYDDSLDPSLIQKYYDNFDDDDYFDLEPQKLTITSSRHNFNLDNEFEEEESSFTNGREDFRDDLSPFLIQVNTNIKRQVNKIGGEETRPEVIGSSHSGRNPVYNMDHDDDEQIPSTIFGRIKIPRKSGEAKAQQALYKMLASNEGRNRAVSDVTCFIPKVTASISNLTRSAITPPTNSNLEDTLYLFSVNNDPQINNNEHLRIRKESVKLVESLGLDGQISESHFRQSDLTLEKQRINFLHLYSPIHREKIRTDVSLVLQSLFRGYVARKKLIKGLVYVEYICTAALGHVWRMKLNKLKMERDLLKSTQLTGTTIISSPVRDHNIRTQTQLEMIPTMNIATFKVSTSLNTGKTLNEKVVSPLRLQSPSQSIPIIDRTLMDHYSRNVERIIQFQALCRGYSKKLSTTIRNLKLERRRHLLTKSHPLIRHVYISFLELLFGKLDLQKDVNDKKKLMEIDNPSTTNIIMKKHKLFPRFLENIYQLFSCNTKNKYRIMRRSLRDVLLESNHPDCKELVDFYDKQKYNLNQIGNVTHELDSESFEMKVFLEFLLDQGNVLPKILAQILLSDQVYERNRHLFDNSFISKQKFKHTILLVHEQKAIHFSTHSKQIYTDKSPMTNDAHAVDIAFLCEELSKVFFDFKYTPALFEKRHYVFHSTVCELLELFRESEDGFGNRTSDYGNNDPIDLNTTSNKIIFNRLIPTLYSMFSMELKTLEMSRRKNPIQTTWDLILTIQQQQALDEHENVQNSLHRHHHSASSLETTIHNVNDTLKQQLEFIKKKKTFTPVELSKIKFKSLICYGLSHKILDKVLTQIFSQSQILAQHVKNHSLILSVPVQNSIISGIVSLQEAHVFTFALSEPLFAP
ncbi:hypothetical protein FDP41_004389 [Naegleria fowleri]|uniref:RUN domain-containing protein n=1 Tax=Naegleria fowleri TaxID=5763 RepID=A0A6A5BRQ2_NAEFO|nr:uncharacterized protein FDP41_004389 [Naegleria fowleri]KAF0976490.1 hypothetical protein FDP41_004389 [Naegleria fowleri]